MADAAPAGTPRSTRRILYWSGAACLLLVAVILFATRVRHEMADFEVYRVAGARFVAGTPLYVAADGHWQFKYLPAFAFAVAPLAECPPVVSRAVWFGLSVMLLVTLLRQSRVLLPEPRRKAVFLVGLTFVTMAKFYVHEINLGQSNLLLAVFVLCAVGAWRAQRDAAAGALLAAAAIVKPYAIVFLPYLVVRRRWPSLAGFGAVLGTALLLPALHYGWSGNISLLREWWAVASASTAPNLLGQDNISIAGMYAAWLGVGSVAARLAVLTSLLLIGACGVTVMRRPSACSPDYLDAALLLFVIPLLSPQGWDYVLLLGTPAIMLLLDRGREFTRPARWLLVACLAVVGLTIWDVLGRHLYSAVMMSRVLTVCVLCEFWLLIRLRTRGIA